MKTYEPESQWLLSLWNFTFPWKGQPTYVDLGCSHPTNKSLTAFVRDLGWRGVAVDGNADYRKDWADAGFADHFRCFVLSDKVTARFVVHENSFTSRISDSPESDRPELWGIRRIEPWVAVGVEDVLRESGIEKIDLLTIDLEGHEFAVLNTLDFDKHQPAFIISEYVTHGEGIDPRVCRMLLDRGYEVIHMTESNLIYRRK